LLPKLDSNDTGFSKEEGIFEYQEEEDQGHTNQGKPSKLDSYLILVLLIAQLRPFFGDSHFRQLWAGGSRLQRDDLEVPSAVV
jgi:hypothetical protein